MTAINSHNIQKKKIQQHVVVARRKLTALLAVTTTMFLLCIENVKAFTAPLSGNSLLNENTILFLASGAHSIAKRWKTTGVVNRNRISLNSRLSMPTPLSRPTAVSMTMAMSSSTNSNSLDSSSNRISNTSKAAFAPQPVTTRTHRTSLAPLRMTFGFGIAPSPEAPPMLDMKTSINAFGGWYNHMDPVARPPVYDDDVMDYSFSSPADSWPSTYDDDAAVTTTSTSFASSRKLSLPRPIRTIRKIAGWVFGSSPARNARGFGTQTFV